MSHHYAEFLCAEEKTMMMMMMMMMMGEEEEAEEKWLSHYSSNHQILLVGEGDFSFSLSLATAFASASNICASSLDSIESLIKKYSKARSNLEELEKLGASLLHEVDATTMKFHPDLSRRKFDRIIFNFPHAGFYGKEDNTLVIKMHRELVRGFFKNARHMLRANGEIHVNHKVKKPFCDWNIEQLASRNSLSLIQIVKFRKEDYPGYNNKRGHGSRSDEPFPLGKCHTLKFRFVPGAKKLSPTITGAGERHCQHQQSWVQMQHQQPWPASYSNLTYHRPQRNSVSDARNHISPSAASAFIANMINDSTSRIRGAIPQQSKGYPMQRNLMLTSESPYAQQHQSQLNLGLPSILHGEFGSLNRRAGQTHGQPELMEAIPQQSKGYPMQRNLMLTSESPYAQQHQSQLNLGLPSILHGEFGSLNRRAGQTHGQRELMEAIPQQSKGYPMQRNLMLTSESPYAQQHQSQLNLGLPSILHGEIGSLNRRAGQTHGQRELMEAIPQQSKGYPMQRNLMLTSESPYAQQHQSQLNLGLPSILHGEFGSLNRRAGQTHGQPELMEATYSHINFPSLENWMINTNHVMQHVGLASIIDRKECSFSIQGRDLYPHHVHPNDVGESVFARRNLREGMWHHHDEMPQSFVNDPYYLQERYQSHRSVLRL